MCRILLLFRRSSVESNKPYFPYSAVTGRLRLACSIFVNSASMVKNRLQSRNKFSLNFCWSQRTAEMPTAAGSSHSHPSCNTPRQISTQTMVVQQLMEHTHAEMSYTFRPFRMNILPTIMEVEHWYLQDQFLFTNRSFSINHPYKHLFCKNNILKTARVFGSLLFSLRTFSFRRHGSLLRPCRWANGLPAGCMHAVGLGVGRVVQLHVATLIVWFMVYACQL